MGKDRAREGNKECRARGKVVKGHLLEQMTFKQRLEGGESGELGGIPSMGNSQCKDPEAASIQFT